MNRILRFGTFLFLSFGLFANAQDIVWTGSALNNDFFTEGNWKDAVTNAVPASGTIDPGININLPLKINNVSVTINAVGAIHLGTGSLAIGLANLKAESLSGGNVTINEEGYIDLSSVTPFLDNVQINLTSGIGWVRTTNYKTTSVSANNLGQIKVNGSASVYKTNLRIDNYYLNGAVIRSNVSSTPLTVYDDASLIGSSGSIAVNVIHSNTAIANSMNNKIESFILKKGFMVTFANEIDGTGKSKNYIASEADLVINILPISLQNQISFIRVMPWNWVTKKGRTGGQVDLNTTWIYNWGTGSISSLNWEFVPMTWGYGASNDMADVNFLIAIYNSPHVMSFNEADNCTGQSGQYGNLCQTDVAVGYYKNLMKTGMRLVSPSCTEGAATSWLKEFNNKAKAQDIRIDVISVHWYDWGSSPAGSPNADPVTVFNRFKTYLTNVRNLYGLPIWISEFNANPNRTTAVNLAFMKLALPYLESLSYIERYNWYQPNSGVADFYTTGTTLSDVGITYRDQISNPSIPGATVNANNNLNLTVVVLGVNQFEKQPFTIYPNPVTTGVLNISGDEEVQSVDVYTILGAKLNVPFEKSQLQVNDLPAGVYFLKVNNQFTFKFIKKY